jgi:hypothetical protein
MRHAHGRRCELLARSDYIRLHRHTQLLQILAFCVSIRKVNSRLVTKGPDNKLNDQKSSVSVAALAFQQIVASEDQTGQMARLKIQTSAQS